MREVTSQTHIARPLVALIKIVIYTIVPFTVEKVRENWVKADRKLGKSLANQFAKTDPKLPVSFQFSSQFYSWRSGAPTVKLTLFRN